MNRGQLHTESLLRAQSWRREASEWASKGEYEAAGACYRYAHDAADTAEHDLSVALAQAYDLGRADGIRRMA